MSVTIEELSQRIKRLIEAFPNYNHKISCPDNHVEDFQSQLLLTGIKMDLVDNHNAYFSYKPEKPIGTIWYNYYTISERYGNYNIQDRGKGICDPLCLNFNPPHPDWEDFSITEPILPALQARIFQAIYGKDWPKYVKLTIRKFQEVEVDCNLVKEKLQ